jgi:antitoxin CcdA
MGKIELKVEVDAALLEQAKEAGVGLSAATEAGLRSAIESVQRGNRFSIVEAATRQRADPTAAAERAKQWAEDNAEAIKTHNERVAARGVFGDDLRRW